MELPAGVAWLLREANLSPESRELLTALGHELYTREHPAVLAAAEPVEPPGRVIDLRELLPVEHEYCPDCGRCTECDPRRTGGRSHGAVCEAARAGAVSLMGGA